jgi:hypothetical protein
MKMIQLKKHPTTNLQRPKSIGIGVGGFSLFDVGYWILDVQGLGFCFGVLLFALAGVAEAQPNVVRSNGTDFASFQIIGQRDIFDPNRVPHRRSSGPAAHVVDSFSFVGTMSYAKGNFAFFDGTSPDFRKVLELKGSIAGFEITAINPRSVTLLSGTNATLLPLGTQMYRDDDGHWVVSSETASYASAGPAPGADRRSLNRRRGGSFSTGSADAAASLSTDNANAAQANGTPETGADAAAPVTPPAAAGGNDALTRLMQRRAQEEQQLGQGQ